MHKLNEKVWTDSMPCVSDNSSVQLTRVRRNTAIRSSVINYIRSGVHITKTYNTLQQQLQQIEYRLLQQLPNILA